MQCRVRRDEKAHPGAADPELSPGLCQALAETYGLASRLEAVHTGNSVGLWGTAGHRLTHSQLEQRDVAAESLGIELVKLWKPGL